MIRSNKLPFARPDLTEEEFQAVRRVMESGWITSGPETDAFEQEFAQYIGAPDAAALNSATAALHLGLVALGIGPGDVVLVPALTFTATAEVVSRTGARPVLLDVDRNSYLLSPEIVESFLSTCTYEAGEYRCKEGRVRAIICVHYGGRVCDLDGLFEICRSTGMELLQDAAHSFPSRDGEGKVGRRGPVTAFSFYATKNITTGEGGMITGDQPEIIQRIRRMRLHGIATPAHRRAGWQYDVVEQGYKYNLSDIASAMGRVQLRRAEEMLQKRKQIHEAYQQAFAFLPGLRLCPEQEASAYHLYTLEIHGSSVAQYPNNSEGSATLDGPPRPDASPKQPNEANQLQLQSGPTLQSPASGRSHAGLDRDDFVAAMEESRIGTGLHFIPLYRMSYYMEKYGLRSSQFPACEEIFESIVSLPIYSAMSEEDTRDVIEAVRNILSTTAE
ncbi:MAG: DegT/DnrJ/EryC1/StrS aminotransferase family protein [Leptospiraceae bacterium]|nr:DegT/DnrJ/EryC1/StrS aminotransferase family protein [Leptospiraceae bacterium]